MESEGKHTKLTSAGYLILALETTKTDSLCLQSQAVKLEKGGILTREAGGRV